ncbi:MAG TPA: hypothetical protein VEI57_09580 [Nitrospirota bacterium]|nr:hypothetical protein [Nitrospirota bacterium]
MFGLGLPELVIIIILIFALTLGVLLYVQTALDNKKKAFLNIASIKTTEAAMPYCSRCGKQGLQGSSYCRYCGEKLSGAPSSPKASNTLSSVTMQDYAVFVGKNSDKYLSKFAKFSIGGIDNFTATWHWPAFFLSFWWLAYRKIYGWAILAFFLSIIPIVGFIAGFMWAMVANYIYYIHAKKKLLKIKQLHLAPETQKAMITVTGGVGSAPWVISAIMVIIAIIAILAVIATPQFTSYRMKAYNAVALADLQKAKSSCELFTLKNNRIPETLEETGFMPLKNVEVTFTKVDDKTYNIYARHKKGSKIYESSSDSLVFFERDSSSEKNPWSPIN